VDAHAYLRGTIVAAIAIFAILAIVGAPQLVSAASTTMKPTTPIAPWDREETLKLENLARHFIVHVPPGFDGHDKLPVVIMIHGAGGTGQGAIEETRWDQKADRENFIAVFPDGVPRNPKRPARFLINPQLWNDESGRGAAAGIPKHDDVGFIAQIIETTETRYGADPNRIYVTGFSNGASMTFTVGVELSDKVAAIAPVAGHLWVLGRELKAPVPMLFIIGTADPLEPLHGGIANLPWGRFQQPPIEVSLARWRTMLECPSKPKTDTHNGGVEELQFTNCAKGAEVVEYFIDDMGHVWPGGRNRLPERMAGADSDKLNATDVIWDFFKSHPKMH
jgi:polyhydroxybutyrate depolymerase